MAHWQLHLGSSNERQLVVPAVFVLSQFMGDDRLRTVTDSSFLPSPLGLLVVAVFQQVVIHQPGVERYLPSVGNGAALAVAGDEAENLRVRNKFGSSGPYNSASKALNVNTRYVAIGWVINGRAHGPDRICGGRPARFNKEKCRAPASTSMRGAR